MEDNKNQTTPLNDIASKIRENIEPIFIESLCKSNSQLESMEGIKELVSWYQKTKKKEDDNDNTTLEKILEIIINETMKYLPQHYADICIENIKINSKDKEQNVKFDVNFQLEPIKSYVEFAVNVNKIRKKAGRIVFEINSSGAIKEVEIFSKKENNSHISFGIISGMIQISIIEVPFMKINKPVEISTKEIEIDLSEFHVS